MHDQTSTPEPTSLEVLILAPTGQDSRLLSTALAESGIASAVFASIEGLCEKPAVRAGALLISEEALTQDALSKLDACIKAQEPWSDLPVVVMTSGGRTTAASAHLVKLFAPNGNVTLLERPFRPVTLISTLQVALRARRRQYQVRELLSFQKNAMRAREEFILVASHELKTPLTSIRLQAEMGLGLKKANYPAPATIEKLMRVIEGSYGQVEKLSRLIDDMIEVLRIGSGKLTIQRSDFDLSGLVLGLVKNYMPVLSAAGCTVHLDLSSKVVGTWDAGRIEQVVSNLFNNVIKYSGGTPLWVSVIEDGDQAVLTVRDGGRGIALENHEKIFKRFERATSPDDLRGLGLGLYICREIVQAHGGTIHVESEPGKGAAFIVRLPLNTPP